MRPLVEFVVWHDDDTGDPCLGVDLQVGLLPLQIPGAVRNQHVPATRDRVVLHTAGDVEETGVVGIEQQHADRLRVTRPEVSGGLVPDEAEVGDRILDGLALGVTDPLGVVQHVGDRALRHPGRSATSFVVARRDL